MKDKKALVLCFTDAGRQTAERVDRFLLERDWNTRTVRVHGGLSALVSEAFQTAELLVFVGSCGIAVRAVAPYLRDKTVDPSVLVADEKALHVIALLSGHIGGANALTRQLADFLGAEGVITTATDINGRFSVDAWAAENGFALDSMQTAKHIAAEILRRDVPFSSDFPLDGALPAGLRCGDEGALGIVLSWKNRRCFDETLLLTPPVLHVGIGCKKNTSLPQLEQAFDALWTEQDFCPQALRRIASIDVKRGEAGLLALCEKRGVVPVFYTAQELSCAEGDFSGSDFVERTVGVDNVCERAAVLSAGEKARLIVKKRAADGVTLAVALEERRIRFE